MNKIIIAWIQSVMWYAIGTTVILLIATSIYYKMKVISLEADMVSNKNELVRIQTISDDMKQKADELPKEIEIVKWRTKERIRVSKEYVYDTSKNENANAINSMQLVFNGLQSEDGNTSMSGSEASQE